MEARNTKAPGHLDRIAGAVAVSSRQRKDGKILPLSGSTRQSQRDLGERDNQRHPDQHKRPTSGTIPGRRALEAGKPEWRGEKPRKSPARREWGLAPMSKESAGDRDL